MYLKADFSDFQKWLSFEEKKVESGCERAVAKGGQYIAEELRVATPVDTGRLRNSWRVDRVSKEGFVYSVEIYNRTPYVLFVEEGHRQQVGRYVPKIGKRLVRPFVKGRWFIKRTMNRLPDDKLISNIANIVASEM